MASPAVPTPHLFAYGTLTDPRCLDDALGHRHSGERLAARLTGFQRLTEAYPYPFIVEAPGKHVDGVLVMDLSVHDFEQLDRYEEIDAAFYARQQVEVEVWGCGPRSIRLQACTYVAGPALVQIASTAS